MKSVSSTWFECIVTYDKMLDNGTTKRAVESYVVDALTFTEAESVIIEQMKVYVVGEFVIKNINPCQFKEVCFSEKDGEDRWFKVKVAFISFDENTGRERLSNVNYLVQADTAEFAIKNMNEVMGGTLNEYRIVANVETKIVDVFKYE